MLDGVRLSGIKQRGIVRKDGTIEIQTPELAEGTVVEVIILVEQEAIAPKSDATAPQDSSTQDTTEYLLSTEANRQHLVDSIRSAESRSNLISFTPEEWNEEHNLHS
ncbi:MAG: hypothetical protein AAFX78_17230 [Cyanobacteria bacterium J06638_20]